MPSRRELCFPCVCQGARLRGVPGTVSGCRQAESNPGQAWTGASRTNLLRATAGNFLKENIDRFGFSVHSCHFGKDTKGVRTTRSHLWCPATPLQGAGGTGIVLDLTTGPAFPAGCSQVHCENLLSVEYAQSSPQFCRCLLPAAGPVPSPAVGVDGWSLVLWERPEGFAWAWTSLGVTLS